MIAGCSLLPSFSSACCATVSSRDDGLEAEVLVLRHQLNVLQQHAPHRLYLTRIDRALFVWLYRGYPRILDAITILRPETIVRWHRKGFAAFWRWKSPSLGGRPQNDKEVRDLIRKMSFENPLWLLKTPKGQESLEIFAPAPYRRGHDYNSFRPRFPALVPCSQPPARPLP